MAKVKTSQTVAEDAPAFVEAPKTRTLETPLEARPVQGEVDISAMTRDVIARFPKIIAKLAE